MTNDESPAVAEIDGAQRSRTRAIVRNVLTIAVFALACFLLYRTLRGYSLDDLIASITEFPLPRLFAALGFAAASYLCLTFNDYFGLRYVGRPLPWRKAALASFCALSLGYNIGMSALASGAIRYRFYSRWGLTGLQIGKLILFSVMTVVFGLMTLAGISLLVRSASAGEVSGLGQPAIVAIALACFSVVGAYLALCAFSRKPSWAQRWVKTIPTFPIAAAQVAVGTINFALVAACLHQILSAEMTLEYFQVASIYVTANSTALISHVPGGLGVLESVVLLILREKDLIGPLLIFRFVYYLVPLVLGAALFAISEIVFRPRRNEAVAEPREEPSAA